MKTSPTSFDKSQPLDTNLPHCNNVCREKSQTVLSKQHNFITQKKRGMKTKQDIYERATSKIIKLLEEGTVAWRRTWGIYGAARNFQSGHTYTGVNMLFLNFFSPHPIPLYLTFNQIRKLKGKVIKGSEAEYVYFYTGYYKDDNGKRISEEDANSGKYDFKALTPVRFLKCYPVFNIEQTEGIEWEKPAPVDRPTY